MKKLAIHIILIIMLGLTAYSNTFHVPFLFDDYYYIVNNETIKSLSNIADFYTQGGRQPFTFTTFAVNWHFSGQNTLSYHVFNIFLHLINGILLYLLIIMTAGLIKYNDNNIRLIALFSSLIFIVHPIQTESVTNIMGRNTVLMTTFYLSGIILFVKIVNSERGRIFYTGVLFLVSLLGMATRENFVAFPFMLVLYDFFFISKQRFRTVAGHYRFYIPVFLSLAYFAYLVLSYDFEDIRHGSARMTPFEYLMTQFSVHWTYLRLLFLPMNQVADYYYPISKTLLEWPVLLSFAGYAGLWTACICLYRKNPVFSFCILWFLITLSPVSSVIPLNNVIFEHRLYLSSIGILVMIVIGIFHLTGLVFRDVRIRKTIFSVSAAFLIIILVSAAYARNIIWQDEIVLWEDAVKKSPYNAMGYFMLGNAYKSRGLQDTAIEQYLISLRLNPYNHEAVSNLGNAYMDKGRFDRAIELYKNSIRLRPDAAELYYNLGNAFYKKGLMEQAISAYRNALSLDPGNRDAQYNLSLAVMMNNAIKSEKLKTGDY